MCIAIVKPKFADFPTTEQFRNCFDTNPHGAGFMYSDGENLIIKKGFMTFKDFINAFEKENISKDKLVFFHFRIATHGLVDGGNTHPFPLSMNVSEQRTEELKYKGFGLIHNGVFKYEKSEFASYDPNGIISDTMLFAMKLKKYLDNRDLLLDNIESAIVYNLYYKDKLTNNLINKCIGYNKVAIMNEKEEYVKYGNWIEDNGVFYSNDDYSFNYEEYCKKYFSSYSYYGNDCCAMCGDVLEFNKWHETTFGDICDECKKAYNFKECEDCGILMFADEEEGNLCEDCLDDRNYDSKFANEYNHFCCQIN